MIIFLSIIVFLSFVGATSGNDYDKEPPRNSTIICVATVAALAMIAIFKN